MMGHQYDQTGETSDNIFVCLSIVQLIENVLLDGWQLFMGLKLGHCEAPARAGAECAPHAQSAKNGANLSKLTKSVRTGVAMVCDPLWVWRVGLPPAGGRGCSPFTNVLLLSVDKVEAAAGQPALVAGGRRHPGEEVPKPLLHFYPPACHR